MARLFNAQHRFFLFLAATIVTLFIRLISLSMGNNLRESHGAVVFSDRGQLKQVALRFTRRHNENGLAAPLRLGFRPGDPGTQYLLRIANFSPFVRIENLNLQPDINTLSCLPHQDAMMFQCGDSDGDGDGDGGTGCDGSCGDGGSDGDGGMC
jgi:hypothetical protein